MMNFTTYQISLLLGLPSQELLDSVYHFAVTDDVGAGEGVEHVRALRAAYLARQRELTELRVGPLVPGTRQRAA